MNRSFPPLAREALRVLVGALACGACSPNQSVKPGAPELVELTILQAGPVATTVTSATPECVSGIMSSDPCLPMGVMADADGGAEVPPDGLCRDAATNNWCTCHADAADAKRGTWSCEPFTNVMAVIAVFDRLLDTAPLDPGDAGALTDVVTTSATSGVPAIELHSDYSSTGASDGFIFNLFGPAFFGNFRGNGPSLFSAPQPEFQSSATVTVSLDASKVRAKDGSTPFKGEGLLQSGTIVFNMAAFAATVTAPADPTMDATVAIAFTNFADPAGHITATANGAAVPVEIATADGGATFTVTPMGGAWPAGATVVVTVDAATTNLLGQAIAAAASATFTAAP